MKHLRSSLLKDIFGLDIVVKNKTIEFPTKTSNYWLNHEYFYLRINHVALYQVCAASNTIFIDPSKNLSHPDLILTWLNGTVLSYLLQYHGFLVLHGSAVVVNHKAILFCGHSGVGKSTLAAALNQKGYPFLADDLLVIRFHGENIELMPLATGVKLWADALAHFNLSYAHFSPVINRPGKFNMPINNAWHHPIKIDRLYEIVPTDEVDAIKFQSIIDFDQLKMLIRNTYRYTMLKPLKKLDLHLKQMIQLAASVPCHQILRPKNQWTLDELVNQLKEDKKIAK